MNKQELIKKIAGSPRGWLPTIENIINEVDREGWLRNPGEPIDPNNIRKGDLVRIVRPDGFITEWTATGAKLYAIVGADYFLLDRPKPELPTEPGARFIAYSQKWCDGPEDQREFVVAGPYVVDLSNGALFNADVFSTDWTVTGVVA